MINPVSNISFKAFKFWGPNYPELTESQKEIKEDIASKLVVRREETNGKFDNRHFYIKPLDKDTIELSELFSVKEFDAGKRKNIKYSDQLVIGEYDKKNPFKIEDYDKAIKEDTKKTVFGFLAQIIGATAILMVAFISAFADKQTMPAKVDKVTTVVKDSVQNVAKDTLQLFK